MLEPEGLWHDFSSTFSESWVCAATHFALADCHAVLNGYQMETSSLLLGMGMSGWGEFRVAQKPRAVTFATAPKVSIP
jgi:hypothetical protein